MNPARHETQTPARLLQATLDASPDLVQVFRAERDGAGAIVDFTCAFSNRAAQNAYGEIVGQSLLTLAEGLPEEDAFAIFKTVVETGRPEQRERCYRHPALNGWFSLSVVRLDDGVAITTTDITVRMHAELELLRLKEGARQAADKYDSLFNSIDQAFCVVEILYDPAGQAFDYRFLEVNGSFTRQTGVTDAVGRTVSALLPTSPERHVDTYSRIVATGLAEQFETEIDDRLFEVSAFRAGTAEERRVAILFNDITERRRDETARRLSEERYRTLFNAIDEGFVVAELVRDAAGAGVDYRVLEVNPAFENISGLRADFAVGRTAREVVPQLEDSWIRNYSLVVDARQPVRFENFVRARDRWFDVYAAPYGEPGSDRFVIVYNDITARKQAEAALLKSERHLRTFNEILEEQVVQRTQALKESRDFLQTMANTTPLGTVLLQPVRDGAGGVADFEYVWANDVARRMAGEEVVGLRLLHRYPHVRVIGLFDAYCAALESGDAGEFEEHYPARNAWLRWIFTPFEKGLYVAVEDITARKHAEQQLLESTGRFEAAIHVSPHVLSILRSIRDDEHRIVDFSFEWVSRSGETLAGRDVTGMRLLEAFPDLGTQGIFRHFVNTAETGVLTDHEGYYRSGDIDLWLCWKAVRFDDGIFVSVEDISKRKAAETALQESKAFAEALTETTPDLITIHRASDQHLLYANHADYWKLPEQNDTMYATTTHQRNRAMVHPDDRERAERFLADRLQLSDGAYLTVELRIDGPIEWVNIRSKIFRRANDGTPLEIFSITTDITARKRAELEQREEHYFLEQVTDNTPHLIYVFDLEEQQFIYINRRIQQLTGIDQEYVYGMGPHLFKKLLHPDDLGRYVDYVQSFGKLRQGEIREMEFRLRVGDGWRWFRSKDHIFKEEAGAVRQVIGLAEDVTYEMMLREKTATGDRGLN